MFEQNSKKLVKEKMDKGAEKDSVWLFCSSVFFLQALTYKIVRARLSVCLLPIYANQLKIYVHLMPTVRVCLHIHAVIWLNILFQKFICVCLFKNQVQESFLELKKTLHWNTFCLCACVCDWQVADLSMGDLLLHNTVIWLNPPASLGKWKKEPELAAFGLYPSNFISDV